MGVFVGGGGGGLTWTLILRIFGMVSITFFFAPPLGIPLNNLRASAQLTGQGTRYSMNNGVDKLLEDAPSSRTFSIEHLCGLYCV